MIRGSVMSEARDTIREVWGVETYRAALEKLDAAERKLIDGPLLASNFYPIATWDRFLDAAYDEVKLRTGATIEQFYARLVRLAGGRLLQMLYKMFLGLMSPTTVAKLIPGFWRRLYTSGEFDVTVNEPGRCVIVFTDDTDAYRKNLIHHLPPGVSLLLNKNGAKNIDSRITRDETGPDGYVCEVTTTYDT